MDFPLSTFIAMFFPGILLFGSIGFLMFIVNYIQNHCKKFCCR